MIDLADTPLNRTIIEMAYEECALAGFDFERTAEEIISAQRKLNALRKRWPWSMAWIDTPYETSSGIADNSGILPEAEEVITLQLALRIAPSLSATLPPEQRAALAAAKSTFIAQNATVPCLSFPSGLPLGAGHRRIYSRGDDYGGKVLVDDTTVEILIDG